MPHFMQLRQRSTGDVIERVSVDARELLATGEWEPADAPSPAPTPAVAPSGPVAPVAHEPAAPMASDEPAPVVAAPAVTAAPPAPPALRKPAKRSRGRA